MNFYTETCNRKLDKELTSLLATLRLYDKVPPDELLPAKAKLLSQYFKEHKLHTAFVAVSGGLDSAVVLGLACKAKEWFRFPKKVVPVLLPVFAEGATGQTEATARGEAVSARLGLPPVCIPLEAHFTQLATHIETASGMPTDPWARGQLVATLRTPTLYYLTSLSSAKGEPAVILGTTNRDEGAYLGYFGKASDGLVDLQLVSDLHKSEVQALAVLMELPSSILGVEPTGDMYDGRLDEEVFGASYPAVELHLRMLTLHETVRAKFVKELSSSSKSLYQVLANRLDKLHAYNKHKYKARSPAIHLDILNRNPLAWNYSKWTHA